MSSRPGEILRTAELQLASAHVEAPRAAVEVLLMWVLDTDRAGLYARSSTLTAHEREAFERAVGRVASGTPVQHLTGEQVFRGLVLRVRPGVFVPRPETELLVDRALELVAGVEAPSVVDVGTGTGAIALAIASERPGARIVATDRSPDAVALALENASRLGVKLDLREGDLLTALDTRDRGALDLVVSNPPYVRSTEFASLPTVVREDPVHALVGEIDVYERLAADAAAWLRGGGGVAVEIGESQAAEVVEVFAGSFTSTRVHRDLTGRDRFVTGRRR